MRLQKVAVAVAIVLFTGLFNACTENEISAEEELLSIRKDEIKEQDT